MAETYDELVMEAGQAPIPAQPGWGFYNPLTQFKKSPERWEADQRRLYVLDRLKDVDGAPAINESSELRDQLASAYQPYASPGYEGIDPATGQTAKVPGQYLGEDSPVWKGLSWAGSLPSAVYNTGRELANRTDRLISYFNGIEPAVHYPGAGAKAAKDLRTFVSPIRPTAKVYREGVDQRDDTRWQDLRDMRKEQDALPYRIIDPRYADYQAQLGYPADQVGGVDYLTEAGVPESVAIPMGVTMDIVTDPFSEFGNAMKLARAGQSAKALRALGFDAAIGAAPEAYVQYADPESAIRKMLRGTPLSDEYQPAKRGGRP